MVGRPALAVLAAACLTAASTLPPCYLGDSGKIIIGQKTYVCLTINGRSRMLVTPVADDFSAVRINNIRSSLPKNTPLIAAGTGSEVTVPTNGTLGDGKYFMLFDVAVGAVRWAPPKLFQELTVTGGSAVATRTIPVYTVVVTVEQGLPVNVVFDEGCFFCEESSSQCVGNVFDNATKTVPTAATSPFRSCASPTTCSATSGAACDLKLFITYTGTDANGAYFQSANLRFSRFRQFGVGQYYNDISSGVDAGVNEVVSRGSEVINGL